LILTHTDEEVHIYAWRLEWLGQKMHRNSFGKFVNAQNVTYSSGSRSLTDSLTVKLRARVAPTKPVTGVAIFIKNLVELALKNAQQSFVKELILTAMVA
jgi:hypothetical protein